MEEARDRGEEHASKKRPKKQSRRDRLGYHNYTESAREKDSASLADKEELVLRM
ncbi:hypothetical protein [Orlajensenia leifsoniae]|uniref:hypothetical protein n=1 Tax=Orlajensenia leifsoniae TaxID=2561933 RepID=UPI00142FBB82|nr:hypothetical protein [Leifsonia flava]